jgi:HSP20 family protein
MYVTRHSLWNNSTPVPPGLRQALDQLQSGRQNESTGEVARPWSPRVDIREDEKRFVILADIPGIDPALIEVSMDKSVLSIKGSREVNGSLGTVAGDAGNDAKAPSGKFTRVERSNGAFHRQFSLPESADADGITASGNHGVLEISIPKKALATPRRITINSGH